jgi:GT2 family glycosyltransferase
MENSKLIVVLGMHRSGTSAITRGLQVMGVTLGDRMMPPVEGNNGRGFWEDIDLNALNAEMLNAIDSDWCHLAAIDSIDIEILHKQGYFLRAVELLRQKVNNVPIFGFKDPRVAKLLPFWKEVFSHCQFDVSYVITVRHPLSVVKSLFKRDSIEAEQGYLLWLGYIIASLAGSAGEKRVLVDYDRLMQAPDRELMRIAKCTGLEIDPAELRNYKNDFLDEGLRHTVYDLNDLLLDDTCPPIVREIYTALLDVASEKTEFDGLELQNKVLHWSEEFERLKSALLLIDKLLMQKVSTTQTVAERDARIFSLKSKIEANDVRIQEKEAQLASLVTSRSWRITAPLRYVMGAARLGANRLSSLAYRIARDVYRRLPVSAETKERLKNFIGHAPFVRRTRLYRKWMAWQTCNGTGDYVNIPKSVEVTQKSAERELEYQPLISLVTPTYNTKPRYVDELINSLRSQTYANWELCIADGGSVQETKDRLSHWQKLDKRIKVKLLEENKGIAGNSIEAFDLADGDYIVLLDHDDFLSSNALMELAFCINKNPDVDFIYSDRAVFSDETKEILAYHYLPGFSPDFLRACNYASHLNAFSRFIIDKVGFIRQGYDGSQDYEFELRVIEKARKIKNIPKVLYYCRACQGSVALNPESKMYAYEAGRKAIQEHTLRVGYEGDVEFMKSTYSYRIHYKVNSNPLVSIIIPNRDHKEDLKKCIESIISKSTYGNYEIIIAENNSKTNDIFSYYDELANVRAIKVIQYNGKDFNFSAINNHAVQFAAGEHILLLNNDTEVISPNWIEEMLAFSQREDIGAVGAKLYYADNRIQHAGLVIGLGGSIASHYHYANDRRHTGYMHRLVMPQNYCAMTGACLMVKKSLYDRVGGLDDVNFKIGLNDVDFCLKLREIGKINVLTPYAELYHYESVSRGLDTTPEKSARLRAESDFFREKWKSYYQNGDPYHNKGICW